MTKNVLSAIVLASVATGCAASANVRAGSQHVSRDAAYEAAYASDGFGLGPSVEDFETDPGIMPMRLDRALPGCTGTYALKILNQDADVYHRITVSGMDVAVFASDGEELPPFLPPRATGYVCLQELGETTVSFEAFARRGRELLPTGQVTEQTLPFSERYNKALGAHMIRIDNGFIGNAG